MGGRVDQMDKWTSIEYGHSVRYFQIYSINAHNSESTQTLWGGCCDVVSPSGMKDSFFQLLRVLPAESPQFSALFEDDFD